MAKNAVVKKEDKAGALIESLRDSMAKALPDHLTPDRMARVVLTEFRKNPKLNECTKESLCGVIITASQLGLEPGVNGQCWMLPFKNKGKMEATFIPGYQGLIELAYRSGLVDYLKGDVVYENDEFDYAFGTDPFIKHRPANGSQGKLAYAYAVGQIKGSSEKIFVVLTAAEVGKIKASSKAGGSSFSPWNGPFESQMWMKSAVKRLLKQMPKSAQNVLNQAMQADDDSEARMAMARVVPEVAEISLGDLTSSDAAHVPVDAPMVDVAEANRLEWIMKGILIDHVKVDAVLEKHGYATPEDAAKDAANYAKIQSAITAAIQ